MYTHFFFEAGNHHLEGEGGEREGGGRSRLCGVKVSYKTRGERAE